MSISGFNNQVVQRKTRICLVIQSLQSGGMERVMSELARFFTTQYNVEIHLLLYGRLRDVFYPIPDTITIHRPKFVFDDDQRLLSTLKTLFFLRRTINVLKPDAILSFGEYWNSFVLLALLGTRHPVYVSDRCQPDKNLGKVHTLLRKWLYPKAVGVIAQTEKAKEIYNAQFEHKNIKVIGNPVKPIDGAANVVERENIVLSVGRLIDTKHHDRLIQMFAEMNVPGWKLVIIGGDALKQKNMLRLQNLVQSLKAQDRIMLTGAQTNVDEYYRKSKIFAFTSSSEGFPNVIAEAMSAGLPVVSFDCIAGPSDMIVDGENGFLIPLFDYETFKLKLKLLIEDEIVREEMAIKAQQSLGRFHVDVIGKEYLSFITEQA